MAPEYEFISEIDWDDETTLMPGVDYHDGVTYFTIPVHRKVIVPAKKKGEDPTLERVLATAVITSERETFWYDKDDLAERGFVPHAQLFQDPLPRWSRQSARAFVEGKISAPSTREMYAEVRGIYTTYVEYADETYFDLMALYVLYTYCYELFEATGYLHFNGTAASGKSRNLSIIRSLAFNPIWVANMSAASLYRKLAGSPGTTCLDESEGFEGERGEELRRILNAGYRRGANVSRTEKVSAAGIETYQPVTYNVYGPKALASINTLDSVIGSRCLIVAMRPAIRELPDFAIDDPRWAEVRDRLYLWALENTDTLAHLVKAWRAHGPDSRKATLAPKLIGRQWEISAPFIVLADYVGGIDLTQKAIAFFNGYFTSQQASLDATDRLRTTLRCLPRVLATKPQQPDRFYTVKDIHAVISDYLEADAAEYFKTKHVTKNLEVLGFRTKKRAAGGLQIQIDEHQLRNEFTQRRVEPFDEDARWFAGEVSLQHDAPTLAYAAPTAKPAADIPWWELSDPDPDLDNLIAEAS